MKVYVAGSSKELGRVKAAIQLLRDYGHEVTHDWPALVEQVGSANPDVDDDTRARWAWADLRGVADAKALWLLVPAVDGGGAYFESGYLLGMQMNEGFGDRLMVASGACHKSIFTSLFNNTFASDLEALDFLTTEEDADV